MAFYDDGLHFSCQRCSNCCRIDPGFVYLSQTDLTNLCQKFKMTVKEFVNVYCRWVQYYDNTEVLCLKEKTNYDCILWNNGCTAYEARPVQCSTFPFWSWILEDKGQWRACSEDCPGINNGRLWTKEEIEEQLKSYEQNLPIHRNELTMESGQ